MLTETEQERAGVKDYMRSQAPDLSVDFLQKVYSEMLGQVRHDVWDVHTDGGRWWVITSPSNLYSQDDFPNMDLALTFHVGLCIRIPRSERPSLSSIPAEPFGECFRMLQEASEALSHAVFRNWRRRSFRLASQRARKPGRRTQHLLFRHL